MEGTLGLSILVLSLASVIFAAPLVLQNTASDLMTSQSMTQLVAAVAITGCGCISLSLPSFLREAKESVTVILSRKGVLEEDKSGSDEAVWRSLHNHSAMLGCAGALVSTATNFGLGSVVTLLLVVATHTCRPMPNRLFWKLPYLLFSLPVMLLVSPPAFILGMAYAEGVDGTRMLENIIHNYITEQNAMWPVLCFYYFPVYFLAGTLLFA